MEQCMQYMYALACEVHASACDVTGLCMQLLHGLCCFDFISDIPLLQLLWALTTKGYLEKTFNSLQGLYYKTFYSRNLQIFVIS